MNTNTPLTRWINVLWIVIAFILLVLIAVSSKLNEILKQNENIYQGSVPLPTATSSSPNVISTPFQLNNEHYHYSPSHEYQYHQHSYANEPFHYSSSRENYDHSSNPQRNGPISSSQMNLYWEQARTARLVPLADNENELLHSWLSGMSQIAQGLRSSIFDLQIQDLLHYFQYNANESARLNALWSQNNQTMRTLNQLIGGYLINPELQFLIHSSRSIRINYKSNDPNQVLVNMLLYGVGTDYPVLNWRFQSFQISGIESPLIPGQIYPVIDCGGGRRDFMTGAIGQLMAVPEVDLATLHSRALLPLSDSSISLNLPLFTYCEGLNFRTSRQLARVWMGSATESHSSDWQRYLDYCRYLGRLIGFMLTQDIQDGNMLFVPSFYKVLLGFRVTREDALAEEPVLFGNWEKLEELDAETFNELSEIRVSMIDAESGETVDVTLNQVQHRNTPTFSLTQENFRPMISVLVQYLLVDIYAVQYQEIRRGLFDILPEAELVLRFDRWETLRDALSGSVELDIEDWKLRTSCEVTDLECDWFWRYVEESDRTKRENILIFMSGSNRLRAGEMCSIYRYFSRYPRGATCSKALQLPYYESYDEFADAMNISLSSLSILEDYIY